MRDVYMSCGSLLRLVQLSPELIMTTRSPRLILPSSMASSNAIGMQAERVTPLLRRMAFLDWHIAPFGRYRDRRFSHLREDQSIHLAAVKPHSANKRLIGAANYLH